MSSGRSRRQVPKPLWHQCPDSSTGFFYIWDKAGPKFGYDNLPLAEEFLETVLLVDKNLQSSQKEEFYWNALLLAGQLADTKEWKYVISFHEKGGGKQRSSYRMLRNWAEGKGIPMATEKPTTDFCRNLASAASAYLANNPCAGGFKHMCEQYDSNMGKTCTFGYFLFDSNKFSAETETMALHHCQKQGW
eukprot:CAMPEP_0177669410 /NCGR_PEP_ID=MMETSP0447-20121125/23429_1 /TAXON_ID=0 /ORGANISM="Stygamoeba regulata, Strain BSH-02190019" /LENGTH=189 /DNA_ID=CAMNT_0019176281 /DNA_START=98 /DNA_END=664 /DNA_ORIENTATION=-